ncbi:hypothetical protein LWI29_010618 [Acer saccharum]|uniref:RRM domain-containing protein n=1 Tax=Acer saccharum TaxID=4024 RepID=A0AA39W585_ACESA|nr:hypothetical protein LWI29_010618 [Acer saccharum]
MRTRNGDNPKPTPAKKTPPARKSTVKAPSPTNPSGSVTPKTIETKRASATKAKQPTTSETKPQELAVEELKALADAAMVTPLKKRVVPVTKSVVKKKVVKTRVPASRKAVLGQTSKLQDSPYEEVEAGKKEEPAVENVEEMEDLVVENVTEGINEEETAAEDDEESFKEAQTSMVVDTTVIMGYSVKQKESLVVEVGKSNEKKEPSFEKKEEEQDSTMEKEFVVLPSFQILEEEELDPEEEDEMEYVDEKVKPQSESVDKVGNLKEELRGDDVYPQHDESGAYEGFEEYGDQVDYGDHEEEEFAEDDIEEPAEETDILEEERRQLKAITNDRRIKKEHEIFVGGLDRDATEEDVKQVFERIGEILEVRLHKNFSTNKNKGYAFVKFANKEHAKRALSEMKNPVICGKRCGTAPSEDNDTLFVGNICNTWTKEAIKQKMKDYGVEGIESITLVPDVQQDGLSRGFAFVEFSCHVDAMAAYKRLQKPDVVFGHSERTVKVAFAEPLREPDPEIMAQVKTVFLDGVPLHWNEDQVREQIKGYGEIVRIVLARNMSTAKRKDYGFLDFSTHEAAVACINGINNKEMIDGNSKMKLKARLSNPLPKTQAVKGGLCGGFRIGHGSGATFSRFGRGSGRSGHHFNSENFHRSRGFYNHGRGQFTRMGHNEHGIGDRYNEFPGRPYFGQGGRRGSFRGHYAPGRAMVESGPSRPNPNRPWHRGPDRGHGDHISHRMQPFSPDEDFDRPFIGRQVDDPYYYDDYGHGAKRPFYTIDHDPDYMGPSRHRPRLDYNDPAVPFHGSRYRDDYGTGSGFYPDDYYSSDYGAYPHYYGDDRSYGGRYY